MPAQRLRHCERGSMTQLPDYLLPAAETEQADDAELRRLLADWRTAKGIIIGMILSAVSGAVVAAVIRAVLW